MGYDKKELELLGNKVEIFFGEQVRHTIGV